MVLWLKPCGDQSVVGCGEPLRLCTQYHIRSGTLVVRVHYGSVVKHCRDQQELLVSEPALTGRVRTRMTEGRGLIDADESAGGLIKARRGWHIEYDHNV